MPRSRVTFAVWPQIFQRRIRNRGNRRFLGRVLVCSDRFDHHLQSKPRRRRVDDGCLQQASTNPLLPSSRKVVAADIRQRLPTLPLVIICVVFKCPSCSHCYIVVLSGNQCNFAFIGGFGLKPPTRCLVGSIQSPISDDGSKFYIWWLCFFHSCQSLVPYGVTRGANNT